MRLVNTGRWSVWTWRIGILAVFLRAWEYLTGIKAISRTPGLYWIDPFIVGFNSLPRIALVPLITMTAGSGLLAKIVLAWSLVFFIVFFNSSRHRVMITGCPAIRPLPFAHAHLLWQDRLTMPGVSCALWYRLR